MKNILLALLVVTSNIIQAGAIEPGWYKRSKDGKGFKKTQEVISHSNLVHILSIKPIFPMSYFKLATPEFLKPSNSHRILMHFNEVAQRKYFNWANENRNEKICFVLESKVLSCRAIAPPTERLYLKGLFIYSNSKKSNDDYLVKIRELISK